MKDTEYAYAVARIHSHELRLLAKQDLEQLLSCGTVEECLRVLADKGWETENGVEQMLARELEKTWELIKELAPEDNIFDVLLYKNDFHNLKAAIKSVVTGSGREGLFMPEGTVALDSLVKAAQDSDFSGLPVYMQEAAKEAKGVLLHTRDGQLADAIIDKAALDAIWQAGQDSKNDFMRDYAELIVATADIKLALRAQKTGKSAEFLKRSLSKCATLDLHELTGAALQGREAFFSYLSATPYGEAADALTVSFSAFEKWCDDRVMARISSAKNQYFGPEPLAGYLLARETEIRAVRIILSAKHNDLPEGTVRERLRDLYV